MDELNIYQRINEVRKKVEYLKKDKKVESYWAVTHDMVTAELRTYLIEFGIVIVPSLVSSETFSTGKSTSRKTPIVRCEAVYDFRMVNIDSPEDFTTARTSGHAEDTGDKAPGKALSYANKYAKLKVFEIETGEGDESRIEAKPTPIGELDVITLKELCEAKGYEGKDADRTLKALAERVYQLKKIEDLPEKQFEDAKERLQTMPRKDELEPKKGS